jgi:acetyl esterase/lipase
VKTLASRPQRGATSGPYLATHGYATFSIDYRLTRDGQNRYPAAVNDVRAAVQWVRSHGAELNIDPSRIALIGESSGTQLAAFVALAGGSPEYTNAYRDDPYATVSTQVKAVVGIYGVYDLMAQWEHDLISSPTDSGTQNLTGFPPMQDRLHGPQPHRSLTPRSPTMALRFYLPTVPTTTSLTPDNLRHSWRL